jgi:hypothetical protein
MSGDEAKYSPQELVQELQHLTQCFEDSAEILVQVKETLAIQDGDAKSKSVSKSSSETLICWPDGFDIGFAIPTFATGAKDGEIKVGFTLGDDKHVPPGYFVRKVSAVPHASRETTIVLPMSQVTADAMSRANVVDYIATKIRDVRRLASN